LALELEKIKTRVSEPHETKISSNFEKDRHFCQRTGLSTNFNFLISLECHLIELSLAMTHSLYLAKLN